MQGVLSKSNSLLLRLKSRNIYITSDEEIKEGDWCYHPLLKGGCIIQSKFDNPNSTMKKIILTTDQDLIKDGVQAIDDDFLEWFVKNPSCEEVKIIKVPYFDESGHSYLLIIPKEEPKFEESTDTTVDIMLLTNSMFGKKEETIEEVAFRLYPIDMRECDNSEDWDINEQYRNEWIAGAKWMKEQYRIKDLRK